VADFPRESGADQPTEEDGNNDDDDDDNNNLCVTTKYHQTPQFILWAS